MGIAEILAEDLLWRCSKETLQRHGVVDASGRVLLVTRRSAGELHHPARRGLAQNVPVSRVVENTDIVYWLVG